MYLKAALVLSPMLNKRKGWIDDYRMLYIKMSYSKN